MQQQITVRAPAKPALAYAGGPAVEREIPLWEVSPHWRRGHWRRLPGHAAYEERGEQPPLCLVRPTFVRRDRLVGPLGDTSATYDGGE